MKKLWFVVLAAGMVVAPMAGCGGGGGDDGSSCADACRKMGNCDLLAVSVDQCIAECEDRIRVEEQATQGDIDCIMENDCADIFNRCDTSGGGGGGGTAQCTDIMTCPGGGGTIGFCAVGGGASCYYTLGGRQYQCASCSDLVGCATAVVNACGL